MSKREQTATTWKGRTQTCTNCHRSHTFTGAQLHADHELSIELQPCHADDCLVMLCDECPQFACDGCGLAHCEEHKRIVDDLSLCPICAAGDDANHPDLADPFDAAVVVAMAAQALEDAALIEGAKLTDREARALLNMQSEAVN